jgi:amidohydrolase
VPGSIEPGSDAPASNQHGSGRREQPATAAPAPSTAPVFTPSPSPELRIPLAPEIVEQAHQWFTWLHQYPELSFQEAETAAFIAERLRAMGYTPRERVGAGPDGAAQFGVVAVLGKGRPGPALALRADIDALPLHEASGVAYPSRRPGVMHACGHDAHTAMLLGAAAAFRQADAEAPFPGPIVLIFQPAEELHPGGALGMIQAGVLDDPPVGAIFGIHQGNKDAGTFSIAAGARNAASDRFRITVTGKGGHAAAPHRAVDPILVGAHVVVALQGIVSRQVAPRQAAVLTVGVFNAGTKENVIPESATLSGTCRTLDPETREQMPARIKAIAGGVCAAFGASAEVEYRQGYDVLVNDAAMAEVARAAAVDVVGEAFIQPAEPGMGGEDFGRYLQKVPGCYVTLGAGDPKLPTDERPSGHSPRFALDPSCLPYGIAFYVALARRWFSQQFGQQAAPSYNQG